MREIKIGKVSEFDDHGRKVVSIDGREIGIFCLGSEFYAYDNICPHMGGPICQGKIIPQVTEIINSDKTSGGFAFCKDKVNIICPWHAYEYDIRSGCHSGNTTIRLSPVPVKVSDGEVIVSLDT